jgi:preprotein translocase subunit SecB
MKPICELEQFFVNKLQVDWLDPNPDIETESGKYGFDYDLSCNTENPNIIRMVMRFAFGPHDQDEEVTCPYKIFTEIEGVFNFSEDIEDSKMGYLCRVNSLTILYGILRGEIANITGSFRNGKFILPTVMMQDVVKEVEKRKESERNKKLEDGAIS